MMNGYKNQGQLIQAQYDADICCHHRHWRGTNNEILIKFGRDCKKYIPRGCHRRTS